MKWYFIVLKKYADFNGRATRSEYWYFFLFNVIASLIVTVVGGLLKVPVLGDIYTLAVLIPAIAVAVRRMHDVDKNGWYCIVPIYNLVLACTDGTAGENKYGGDPKRPEFDTFLETTAAN